MITNAADLREAIAEAAEHTPDPEAVASKIVENLTAAECRVVASLTLGNYCRLQMAKLPQGAREPKVHETTGGTRTVSRKVAGIRDWYVKALDTSVYADTWLKLGDCRVTDLDVIAQRRDAQAKATAAERDRYLAIRDALTEHGATFVRDLPRDVGAKLLG